MGSLSLLMQLVIVAFLREMELMHLHAATFLYLLFPTFMFGVGTRRPRSDDPFTSFASI